MQEFAFQYSYTGVETCKGFLETELPTQCSQTSKQCSEDGCMAMKRQSMRQNIFKGSRSCMTPTTEQRTYFTPRLVSAGSALRSIHPTVSQAATELICTPTGWGKEAHTTKRAMQPPLPNFIRMPDEDDHNDTLKNIWWGCKGICDEDVEVEGFDYCRKV